MNNPMSVVEIDDWLKNHFTDVVVKKKYGETTYFYNPNNLLPHGVYFLTIKESDGPNDQASDLNRPGVFRVSWQLKDTEFQEKFGKRPTRPAKGESIQTKFDLTELDTHLPHAVYGWMGWSMILSPSVERFESLKDSIGEAYGMAKDKFEKKTRNL